MELAIIRHRTSGDVYVASTRGDGTITARSLPLPYYEWENEEQEVQPDLDLDVFALDDDWEHTDEDYRYLATQAPGGPLIIH